MQNSKSILITGGTGMVGSCLTDMLIKKGHTVSYLSRESNNNGIKTYMWDINKGIIDEGAIEQADVIIHLAGAGIADKRWTKKRKKEIVDSRVKSANLIFEYLKALDKRPEAFISSSGAGYYGAITSDVIFTEDYPPGKDFLGETCRLWEEAADRFMMAGMRVVKLRTGVVLKKNGGALVKMATPVKKYVGAPLGTGKQYMPWIHINDLCRLYIEAIENPLMMGAFNACSNSYVTNKELTRAIAKVLKKPLLLPNVPKVALKALLGEMAEMITEGSRVCSDKVLNKGFKFNHTDIHEAIRDCLK